MYVTMNRNVSETTGIQQKPKLHKPKTMKLAACSTLKDWIEEGLTSHQTHYRSYWGRVFTGQITQPTVSKH